MKKVELFSSDCCKVALLWERERSSIRCETCERHCLIPEGKAGFCGARVNVNGKLYVRTYGNASSTSNNPMSKKPFFHFHPGESALSIGSWGCNAQCPWCQNWRISKTNASETECNYLSPQTFVKKASQISSGTSFTFNEPVATLFEYSLEVMPLAHEHGLFNTYVTNGYMSLKALTELVDAGLDAVQIDIKGCEKAEEWTGLDTSLVWRNANKLKQEGVHVEITTLIIPQVNDDEACLRRIGRKIKEELGAETPWHVTRYFRAFKAKEKGLKEKTPKQTIEKAYKIGKEVGLEYVYTGNLPGHQSTYCPNCGKKVIDREESLREKVLIEEPECPECGKSLPLVLSREQ